LLSLLSSSFLLSLSVGVEVEGVLVLALVLLLLLLGVTLAVVETVGLGEVVMHLLFPVGEFWFFLFAFHAMRGTVSSSSVSSSESLLAFLRVSGAGAREGDWSCCVSDGCCFGGGCTDVMDCVVCCDFCGCC
jgi:hypothetical protein